MWRGERQRSGFVVRRIVWRIMQGRGQKLKNQQYGHHGFTLNDFQNPT
jgi:hypothetical protein